MKKSPLTLLLFICFNSFILNAQTSLINKVNPFIGTQKEIGDTGAINYPVTGLPFGMNLWTPQTFNKEGLIYNYSDDKITGFRQTHQINSEQKDYGAFALMPMGDTLIINAEKRAAGFNHFSEKAYPYHYRVRMNNGITSEIVPTDRAAIMRFKYPYGGKSYVLLDVLEGISKIEIIPNERKIVGYCTNNNGNVPSNFAKYFVIKFLREFDDYGIWQNDTISTKQLTANGNAVGAWGMFDLNPNEVVTVEVASSYISIEQAERNLLNELSGKTFETVKQQAQTKWNDELSQFVIEGGTEKQQQLFYTSLYRMLLVPRIQYEIDPSGNTVHYSFYDGKLYNREMFIDNVFNGTYKAVKVLYDIINPGLYNRVYNNYIAAVGEGKIKFSHISYYKELNECYFCDTTKTHQNAYWDVYQGKPWEMQKKVWELFPAFNTAESFKLTNDLSSWYVFSSIGIYPVDSVYILGRPLFDKITINFPKGKTFSIFTNENIPENVYVKSVLLNNNPVNGYIDYKDVLDINIKASSLIFTMDTEPDTDTTKINIPELKLMDN